MGEWPSGLGEPAYDTVETAIDNVELIEVNDAIRNHPIETIGKQLRKAMTAMKRIKTETKQEAVLV